MNFSRIKYCYVFIFTCMLLLTACNQNTSVTQVKWEALELRMTLEQVEEIMGGPGKIKTFKGQNPEAIFYQWKDANTSDHIFVGILDGSVASMTSSFPYNRIKLFLFSGL